ncbi:Fc.00g007830.m01.CDS01 [Cosmosporella sp. VM-42]
MSNTTAAPAPPTSEAASTPAPPATSSPVESPVDTAPASSPDPSTEAPQATTEAPPATTATPDAPTSTPAEQPTSESVPPLETTPEQSVPVETPTSEPAPTTQPADPTTSAAPEPTTAPDPATSSEDAPTTAPVDVQSSTEVPLTTIVTVTPSDGTSAQTSVVVVIGTSTNEASVPSLTTSASGTSTATPIDPSGGSGSGLNQKSKVAIGVVVPIAAIAILALVGLFWWKKRRARQQAEEERRKEVEDYSYNPNADPTIPNVAMTSDGAYEMREDGSAGYRGWGNTTVGSSGRKASTTMSGGVVSGQAYSDATSPTMRGNMSDAPLMDGHQSPEGEILGQMGPSASNNRGADVHRGPSNASSSYSAAARSEGSDGVGVPYGAGGTYYDQYAQNNPYNEQAFNGQQGPPNQPVIRDNPARRNTRIENPAHYPQQSAGISQNF